MSSRLPARLPLLRSLALALMFLPLTASAEATPAQQLWSLHADNAAQIREARQALERDWTHNRHRLVDAAIADNRRLQALAAEADAEAVLRALRLDLLLALQARGASAEVLARAAELEQGGEVLPPYAQQAVGDALMQARRPREAAERYRNVLAVQPGDEAARSALGFALLEAEEHRALLQTLAELARAHPGDAAVERRLAQMARFTDRPAQAQAHLAAAQALAPADAANALEAGALAASRGLPRQARTHFEQVLATAPDNVHARIGVAEADWAMGNLVAAGAGIAALQAEMPEHPGVRRLIDAWALGARPQLAVDITTGQGEGVISGNDDLVTDTWLYSPRLGSSTRLFVHHFLNRAEFPRDEDYRSERAHHERGAVGLEITGIGWQAAVEAGHTLDNARHPTFGLRGAWQPDDHWSLRALYETRTDDFPLKGRLEPSTLPPGTTPGERRGDDGDPRHLHADRGVLGVAYRWHESRRVAADLSTYSFNDGNTRTALNTAWTERLLRQPGTTLDLQTSVYTSRNTKPGPIYFNPSRDYAVAATLTADWLSWRHYERRFNQRLSGTAGNYLQYSEGDSGEFSHGWKPWYDLRYEHEWQAGPALVTRYGIGTRRFAYDGDYERKTYAYLNINWRF